MGKRNQRTSDVTHIEMRTVGGAALFSQPVLAGKLIDGLKWSCEHRGLRIYDYIILPDRLLIIGKTAWGNLDDVIHSYRDFSSKAVMRTLHGLNPVSEISGLMTIIMDSPQNRNSMLPQIWDRELIRNHLYSQEDIDRLSQNIANIPVKMGWVDQPEHYKLSSACPSHPLEGWILEAVDRWR
ncbi:MAG: hypothetical protein R3283_09760 [Balneolaceae bacterium]|nr:hypothetical protein [Balneolaceae bacterium]